MISYCVVRMSYIVGGVNKNKAEPPCRLDSPAAPHSCLRQEDVGETRGQASRDAEAGGSRINLLLIIDYLLLVGIFCFSMSDLVGGLAAESFLFFRRGLSGFD